MAITRVPHSLTEVDTRSIVGVYDTRANFVSNLSYLDYIEDGGVVIADELMYVKATGATAISDLNDWLPWKDVSPWHFGDKPSIVTTNQSATIALAEAYLDSIGGGFLYFGRGDFGLGGHVTKYNNITWVGEGSGYQNAEHVQKDKAKTIANAPTRIVYVGDTDGTMWERRPPTYYARRKISGGGARDIMFDGVSNTNKAGIILREQNVEHGEFHSCSFFGATERMVDVTGMLTGFSDGDNNSAYTKFFSCLFNDKVVSSAGVNRAGGGHCMVIGGEFNATNIYLNDCHMVSSSGSVEELLLENTDHSVFYNQRCNVGGTIVHADDTGTFNVRHFIRYKDEQNGGFAVGDSVTGASSSATGTVDEVREGNDGGMGAIFLTSVTGTFTAGENLQVSATTRGVGEDRTHIKLYDVVGTLTVGQTLTGATSGATLVIDEAILDEDGLAGVVFSESGNVTGTFQADEELQISSTTVATAVSAQVVIGASSDWSVHREPSAFARLNKFFRLFSAGLTFKASTSTTVHSLGNMVFGYATVDPFGIGLPTWEDGATAVVYADSAEDELASRVSTPITLGGQPTTVFAARATGVNVPNNAWTNTTWDSEENDPLQIYSTGTTFTIPAWAQRVKITAGVQFANNTTGQRGIRTFFAGTAPVAQPVGNLEQIINATSGAGVTTLSATSAWLPVTEGYTFTVQLFQDSGGVLAANATNTWVEVEYK